MSYLPNLDQKDALATINDALQIQLEVGKDKPADSFLGRIYEEKGHILKGLAEQSKAGEEMVTYYARSLQCFNSAFAIIAVSKDTAR